MLPVVEEQREPTRPRGRVPLQKTGVHEEDDAVSIGAATPSGAARLLREPRAQAAMTVKLLVASSMARSREQNGPSQKYKFLCYGTPAIRTSRAGGVGAWRLAWIKTGFSQLVARNLVRLPLSRRPVYLEFAKHDSGRRTSH